MATSIRFARLVHTHNYENFRLEIEQDLAVGDNIPEVIELLQGAVDAAVAARWAAVGLGEPPPDLAHPLRPVAAQLAAPERSDNP